MQVNRMAGGHAVAFADLSMTTSTSEEVDDDHRNFSSTL